MDVTDEAVALGNSAQLIQNLGPDDLYLLPHGAVSEENGTKVVAGQAVAVGFSNGGMWAVSSGESDVRLLVGCTGIFSLPTE